MSYERESLEALKEELASLKKELQEQKLALEMQQAQKLESLGLMAGGIAHDFNNLLVGVLGNVDLALLDVDPHSPFKPYLDKILKGATRLSELTNQMLAFSGRGTYILEPVNLSDLAKKLLPLVQTTASKKVSFRTEFESDLPSIQADSSQLQQVVVNLITNAIESIGDSRGTISVSTGTTKCPDKISKAKDGFRAKYCAFLKVADNGSGISDEVKKRIFDPFFTTKFTGRGLGLATVIGIVQSHHGEIHLETVSGEGSAFTVFFPITDEIIQKEHDLKKSSMQTKKGTVLVVDDEAVVREVTQTILSVSEFHVLTAADGIEAVEIVRAEPAIDIVILDLTMPNMDGIETFSRLREIRPNLPVILSSGYSEQASIAKFKMKGLAGFIQKPYRIQELVDKVLSVLSFEAD